jgi:division protein CdvB (Snf7/Vps24/ESCRT-III family)
MTVQELISRLEQMDKNMHVYIDNDDVLTAVEDVEEFITGFTDDDSPEIEVCVLTTVPDIRDISIGTSEEYNEDKEMPIVKGFDSPKQDMMSIKRGSL